MLRITKYEHACFTVEKDGKLLIIDPGNLTTDLVPPDGSVAGIVVTHEHSDHFDPAALGAIYAHNPDALIIGTEYITQQLGDTLPTKTITAGSTIELKPFKLEFFGGEHALIHKDIPVVANTGVMIDGRIYYPGDSFTIPDKQVDILALPITAPWLKISEAIDFMSQIKPNLAFPTHDAIASNAGKSIADNLIGQAADAANISFKRLESQQTLDINS